MDTCSHRCIAGHQGQLGRLAPLGLAYRRRELPAFRLFYKNKWSKNVSKTWVFIGGMVAGIAGVFAAAFAAEELDDHKQPSKDGTIETENLLALPEAKKP